MSLPSGMAEKKPPDLPKLAPGKGRTLRTGFTTGTWLFAKGAKLFCVS